MPKQYVIFGRPLPRIGTRRLSSLLIGLTLFAVCSLLFMLPNAIPTGPSLQIADHKFSIPKSLKGPWINSLNPWMQPSHPPPRQQNDTYGEASWYANWRWLSIPFSSSVTLDENRSLLPELQPRTPIYCYYDNTVEKDKASKSAESDLLLTWRRAWWAKGFKPIILSPAEVTNNPLYERVQAKEMDPSLKSELMRWLAWENMHGGLLAHYYLFPMGPHEDPLLTYLRRGEFPGLTRWKDIDGGLFAGSKIDITAAIKKAIDSPNLATAKDMVSIFAPAAESEDKVFTVDDTPKSLAFYNALNIEKKYSKVGEAIKADRPAGLKSLNQLVTSHLHLTWQNIFSDGISVVKPLPKHTTHMITPAYELALRLTHCPESPLPASCPPNLPKCSPCVASQPMRIKTPADYRNNSEIYTIGTVPHPYTVATLASMRERIDVAWIRRESGRDTWLYSMTRELDGTGVSGAPRVLRFKKAVASERGAASSLWLIAESEALPDDLDWHFGFVVPSETTWASDGKSETPVPGPERRPQPPAAERTDGPVAKPEELKLEPGLLDHARAVGKSSSREHVMIRDAIEAWNLADTEAWRFARAFLARKTVERKKWEQEEAKYAGGAGSEKGRRTDSWNRWLEKA